MAKRDYRLSPKERAAQPLVAPIWAHLADRVARGTERGDALRATLAIVRMATRLAPGLVALPDYFSRTDERRSA